MTLSALSLAPACMASAPRHTDVRGSFSRLFCARELDSVLGGRSICQVNLSRNERAGTVRGLHYQLAPAAEQKFVRCLSGSIFDVIVDLRKGSTTFLQWYGDVLSADNGNMMVVPEGFAHGFQSLEPATQVLYLHTAFYAPERQAGVAYDDPRLGVAWPRAVTCVSDRDRLLPPVDEGFEGVVV